ncbi:hypothetical protein H7J86_32195 [Mycobacterium hackensackense]|uniref:hypothetical protein n=1 Tax=Mycobacterium hackensackense TaxID=228909 RepID=UPI0022658A90|nr:hypothetical protein [Mycobacterium hackensackense]MCV7256847.1 hypothetical protein [Mycobacterium hackensackense]
MTGAWEQCPPEINPARKLLDSHATTPAGGTTFSGPTPATASANQHDQVQR